MRRRKGKDPGAAATAHGAGYVGIGKATPHNKPASLIGAIAAPKPKSRVAAIYAKCRECIHDPMAPGNWRQQVEACSSTNCPLHPFRPISRPKTRAASANAILPPSHDVSCAGGPKSGQFRMPIDHAPPPAAPPLEPSDCYSEWPALHSPEKNEKTGQPEWRGS
jgi:hypothetical protein